jgi:hypothetical protein
MAECCMMADINSIPCMEVDTPTAFKLPVMTRVWLPEAPPLHRAVSPRQPIRECWIMERQTEKEVRVSCHAYPDQATLNLLVTFLTCVTLLNSQSCNLRFLTFHWLLSVCCTPCGRGFESRRRRSFYCHRTPWATPRTTHACETCMASGQW